VAQTEAFTGMVLADTINKGRAANPNVSNQTLFVVAGGLTWIAIDNWKRSSPLPAPGGPSAAARSQPAPRPDRDKRSPVQPPPRYVQREVTTSYSHQGRWVSDEAPLQEITNPEIIMKVWLLEPVGQVEVFVNEDKKVANLTLLNLNKTLRWKIRGNKLRIVVSPNHEGADVNRLVYFDITMRWMELIPPQCQGPCSLPRQRGKK